MRSLMLADGAEREGRTCARKRENGKPLSREKAKSCWEVVASIVVEQKIITIITIATMVFVPA